jgi:hypothetical protein
MRAALLASAISIGWASVSMAFRVAPEGAAPEAVRLHGCHQTYGQDVTGCHRHDRGGQTLRGVVTGTAGPSNGKRDDL